MASYLSTVFPDRTPQQLRELVRERPLCVALTLLFKSLTEGCDTYEKFNDSLDAHQRTLLLSMMRSRFATNDECMAASGDLIAHLNNDDVERLESSMSVGQKDLLVLFVQVFGGHRGFEESLLELEYHPEGIRFSDGDPIEPLVSAVRTTSPIRTIVARDVDEIATPGWRRDSERQRYVERMQAALATPERDPDRPLPSPLTREQMRERLADLPITLGRMGFEYEQMVTLFEGAKLDMTTLRAMQKLHAELVDQVAGVLECKSS